MSASDLHSKTLPQLRALAKARGLEGITGLKKADLVARLLEAGVDAPAPGPVAPAEPARSEMPVSAPEAARPEAAAPAESTAPRRRGRSGRQGAPTGVRHDAEERDVEASRDLEPEPEPEQQHEPQGSIASTAPMPTAAPPAPTGFVVPSAPVTFGTPDPAESVPVPPMGAEVELPGVTMRDKPDRPDAAEEEPPRHTETVDRDRHEPRYEYTRGRLSGRSRRGDRGGNGDSRHEAPRVDGRPDQRSGQRHDGRGDGRPQQDARPDRRGRGDSRDMREPRDGRGEAEGDARHLVTGILEILPEGRGFLRRAGYLPANDDVYVSESQIRRFGLRTGDTVVGEARPPRDGTSERYYSLLRIESVNSAEPESCRNRPDFEDLTPIFPTERFVLETDRNRLSNRLIDIISPIGKGQRGLIVAPPKAGKTTILKDIAHALITNNPEVVLLVLLVDERPEEVTDISRAVGSGGEVIASTFDQLPENHMRAADFCLERAKRLVEHGRDVTILLDSLTRLARASK
ncbi:MAG TPA: transcription termination factor Rho, partial [Armatimonadota bacterium]|nr:transcription termination factor Rho [Armatimonadota bacterium]